MIQHSKFTINNQNGVTIVEILIAIAILSFLSFAMIGLTEQVPRVADEVITEDREALKIETAMARLEWDFSQQYTPLFFSHLMNPEGMTPEEGEIYNSLIERYQRNPRFNLLSFDGIPIPTVQTEAKSSLAFFTTANRRKIQNAKQSNFAWVKYGLEDDDQENDPNLQSSSEKHSMLIRKFDPTDVFKESNFEWEDVKSQILLRGVIKILFEFWNPENQKWTDNLEIIKYGKNIIYALKITLDYVDEDGEPKKSIRIFRPLFPEFTPEDMYKFLNANTAKPGTFQGTGGVNPQSPSAGESN